MRFAFTDEQLALRAGVADLLAERCTPDDLRGAADGDLDRDRWAALAELGLTALTVPETHGGLGMDEVALVACLEEAGRVALPEPVGDVAGVAAPLLAGIGGPVADEWLPRIATGEAIVLAAVGPDRLLPFADAADLLLATDGGALHAVDGAQVATHREPGVDPARQAVAATWDVGAAMTLTDDAEAAVAAARDRGTLAVAAELLGLTATMIDLATRHAGTREQFGRPIGAFQAVKHRLADAFVRLEFARPVVYRAAHSVATDAATRRRDVAMAKLYAAEAAGYAAKAALQVHGAIGYTEEHDLHLWMTRVWGLVPRWGDTVHHRAAVADAVLHA